MIDLPDGRRYEGELNAGGLPHGQGACVWPDGDHPERTLGGGPAQLAQGGAMREPDRTR